MSDDTYRCDLCGGGIGDDEECYFGYEGGELLAWHGDCRTWLDFWWSRDE